MATTGGWQIILFLMILGGAMQFFSTLHVSQVAIQSPGTNITMSNIEDTASAVQNSPMGIFVIYEWILAFLPILVSALEAVLSLAYVFWGLGFTSNPLILAIIQLVQLPAIFVEFMWLYEVITGHIL